jgi:hypothetical protein
MPRMPPPADPRDPRLNDLRDREGVLFSDGVRVGVVVLRSMVFTPSTGGLLWWRRWGAPVETIEEFVALDDGPDQDALVLPANLPAVIGQWEAGFVEALGRRFRVEWGERLTDLDSPY